MRQWRIQRGCARGWHSILLKNGVIFLCEIDKKMTNNVLAHPFSVETRLAPPFSKCVGSAQWWNFYYWVMSTYNVGVGHFYRWCGSETGAGFKAHSPFSDIVLLIPCKFFFLSFSAFPFNGSISSHLSKNETNVRWLSKFIQLIDFYGHFFSNVNKTSIGQYKIFNFKANR